MRHRIEAVQIILRTHCDCHIFPPYSCLCCIRISNGYDQIGRNTDILTYGHVRLVFTTVPKFTLLEL